MDSEPRRPFLVSRSTLAWSLGALLTVAYVALPEGTHTQSSATVEDGAEADDERARPEIWSVSPNDPYPGSTVVVVHRPTSQPLQVLAGRARLRVLARRSGELVAQLPGSLQPGELKLRIAASATDSSAKAGVRSKPFSLRVRTPNWRKVYRSLLGGAALVILGIGFLARGVQRSTGLNAARWLTRAVRRRSVVLAFGTALGAVAQSSTGAAGMLTGLASSRVLPVLPAAVAFLGVPLGAAAVPLLATGLVEPHEGLIAVAVGVLWLSLAVDRRSHALARLVLGAGLVALGLQVLRPGLEPFLSDAMLWSLAGRLHSDGLGNLLLCAALGALIVAGLHGPAPLIVLILGVSQATGHWNLRTDLALLSGTGLGASLAALITAPSGVPARALGRLNLCLGALSTLIGICTVDLWARAADLVLGPLVSPLHWTRRVELGDLGVRLAVAFGLSQILTALVLMFVAPRIAYWLDKRRVPVATVSSLPLSLTAALRTALERVLGRQQAALAEIVALALTGTRSHGHDAERALVDAREALDRVLSGPVRDLAGEPESAKLGAAAYVSLQLLSALDGLLRQTERMTDARIASVGAVSDVSALPWDDEPVLRSLHRLISEGLAAAHASVLRREPVDLDAARTREIEINRIELDARGMLLDLDYAADLRESHLYVLQVVDAYEVCGNQVYRLLEVLSHGNADSSLLAG